MFTGEDRSGVGTGNGQKNWWIAQHKTHSLFFSDDQEMKDIFELFNDYYQLGFRLMIRAFNKGRRWGQCHFTRKTIYIYPEGRTVGVLIHELAHAVADKRYGKSSRYHNFEFYTTLEELLRKWDEKMGQYINVHA